MKKEKGVAMRGQSSLKLSDLGSATVVYSRQDADYLRRQERLSYQIIHLKIFILQG